MEYLGIIFGIFGLMAYLQSESLKKRVHVLEEELSKISGTSAYDERRSLLGAVQDYIGKQVNLDLKEDCEDYDIISYGNTKHGSNTILDADDERILVRIDSAKGSKEKLIRVGSVKRITSK